jgi:CRISPR-associated protein Cmr1
MVMDRLTCTVEFVTPCFMGGADNQTTAEWRAASIRGQLRWWFRAIACGMCSGDISKVKQLEAKSWGDTGRCSSIKIVAQPLRKESIETDKCSFERTKEPDEEGRRGKESINGPVYLGYGLFELAPTSKTRKGKDGEIKQVKEFINCRPFIKPTTTTYLLIRKSGQFTELERLSLECWSFFGGIGSRSRRGYGSVQLTCKGEVLSLSSDIAARTIARLKELIKVDEFGMNNSIPWKSYPEYSCFSKYSRIFRWGESYYRWDDAMQAVGKAMIKFRRRYSKKNENDGTVIYSRDYQWAYKNHDKNALIPDRAGFGLPLPFGEVVVQGTDHDRRASPLLIHISKDGSEKPYRPILLYLPARFLPANESIVYGGKKGNRNKGPVEERHHEILQNFLSSCSSLTKEVK